MQDKTVGTALASSSPNNGLFELFVFLHCNHKVKGNIQTSRRLDLEREDTELVVVEER